MAYDVLRGKNIPRDWSLGSVGVGVDTAPAAPPLAHLAFHAPVAPSAKVEVWTPKQAAKLAKVVDKKIAARSAVNGPARELARKWNVFKKNVPKTALANSKTVVALKGWNEASDRVVTPVRRKPATPAQVQKVEDKPILPTLLKVGAAVAVLGCLI